MTKLTLTFEEKDYGADVNVEFDGNVKDIVNAFGSLEYELISKLIEKKNVSKAQAVGKMAKTSVSVVRDYILDNNIKVYEDLRNMEMEDVSALATVFMTGVFSFSSSGIIEGNGEKFQ